MQLKTLATWVFWRQLPRKIWSATKKKTSAWHKHLELRIGKLIVWPLYFFTLFIFIPYAWYFYIDESNVPDIKPFIEFEPPVIGQIRDSNGKVIIELASEYRRIVRYEEISPVIRQAILSAEDSRFFHFTHRGIDYFAILRALADDIPDTIIDSYHRGRISVVNSQGASTLTQQIVRLYFLSNMTRVEKSDTPISDSYLARILAPIVGVRTVNKFTRKIREIKYSIWLEKELSRYYGSREEAKRQIFIRFANYTYFGNGRYGVEAASEYYFGEKSSDLTAEDAEKAALIAGMIKNPAVYGPRPNQSDKDRDAQKLRRDQILLLMSQEGYIAENRLSQFTAKPMEFTFKRERTIAPSAVNQTFMEIKENEFEIKNIFQGNINIDTTIDLRIQQIANEACENGLIEYEKRHPEQKGQTQCSAVVLRNNDGGILAEVGGRKTYQNREYKYSDLNRVNRTRQAGSSFKPFVYLTAFMNGWKPTDYIADAPVGISMGYGRGTHWIRNYDGKYLGNLTMCEALYRSRNAPTVRLTMSLGQGSFEQSGMKKIIDTARALGIKSQFHSAVDHLNRTVYYPTSALGASEMTILELTNAYREMASGISAQPYIIEKVINRNKKTVFEKNHETKPSSIPLEALNSLRTCLRRVVTKPGGTAYSLTLENFPVPVMGKTGTTDDFRNALFIGSSYGSTGITVGIRLDFDDNRELGSGETGARGPLPIFKEIVRKTYEQNLVGPAPKFPEEIENPELIEMIPEIDPVL